VDTQGLLLHAIVHAADIQDRDGGVLLMAILRHLHPFLRKLYADGGYQGPQFQACVREGMRQINVEIVKRSDTAKSFAVLPERWIVEVVFTQMTKPDVFAVWVGENTFWLGGMPKAQRSPASSSAWRKAATLPYSPLPSTQPKRTPWARRRAISSKAIRHLVRPSTASGTCATQRRRSTHDNAVKNGLSQVSRRGRHISTPGRATAPHPTSKPNTCYMVI
jgi:transposase